MTEIKVSMRRHVILRFLSLLLVIFVSARVMLHDSSQPYQALGTLLFIGANMRAILLAMYFQYRTRTGWTETIDIRNE